LPKLFCFTLIYWY